MRGDWQTIKLPRCVRQVKIPKKVPRKSFLENGEYPIVSQERAPINGYWDEAGHAIKVDRPIVAYGDHTQTVKYIDFDFVVGADGLKVFLTNDEVLPRYFYYYLLGNPVKDLGYARHYRLLKELDVHFPPLPEQERIVSILDKAFEGIDKAIAQTEQNLTSARELFESYLNNIFTQKGEDWVEKKLGEVCIVERGSSPRPIKQYLTEDESGVNWVKIGDTQGIEKIIRNTRQKITPEGAKKSRKVNCGDFILTNSMTFGKPYIMGIEGYIHDGWFVLRLEDEVLTEYFYYLLSSNYVQEQFQSLAAGAVVKNISSDLVKKARLPIPSLSEQEEAVTTLNELKQHTAKLEALYTQKLNDLKELKQSLLQQAFAGELTKEDAA